MTEAWSSDFEGLLRQAMAPVEPPERLSEHLEKTLSELTDLAAEELEGWELSSMRDPRNGCARWWRSASAQRPVQLVALRVRSRSRPAASSPGRLDLAGRRSRTSLTKQEAARPPIRFACHDVPTGRCSGRSR